MEERKSYGMVVLFVSVFVVFLVSIMSYSLWRDRQVNAFMTTNPVSYTHLLANETREDIVIPIL
ncbi:hypothetical protein DZ695_28735, partial [Klebsiella pneumoniae]